MFIDNPLSTNNPDSFWNTTLDSQISEQHLKAKTLINTIKLLYKTFALNYSSNGFIQNIGLHNEPYFKYFNYPDFSTINSGLIQIRKYSEINNKSDSSDLFKQINEQTKNVKEEIYKLLVEDFKYFE